MSLFSWPVCISPFKLKQENLDLVLTIALIVFMANAEMLESKYLIGVKNTFEVS